MKRILSVFLVLGFSAALVVVATNWKHSVTAVHAQDGCSNATLTGNYAFIYSGAFSPSGRGKNTVGDAAVGVLIVAGTGNRSLTCTDVHSGKVISTRVPA